jgi:hypothetical protein
MDTSLTRSIIEKEYICLVYQILRQYASWSASIADLEKKLWVVTPGDRMLHFYAEDRTKPIGYQFKSVQVEKGHEMRDLDWFSKEYIEPVAWEICIPCIPPEVLYYWAQ